jgi:nicotinic acid mononucleotide adenylyltransferase
MKSGHWPCAHSVCRASCAFDTVLLLTGSLNPVHSSHVKLAAWSKQQLEAQGLTISAAVFSPSHDGYVQGKLGSEAIPGIHRLAMLELALHSEPSVAQWGFADSYELDARRFIDFPQVTSDLQTRLDAVLGAGQFTVMYVCGADHALKCGLLDNGVGGRHVAITERPGYRLRSFNPAKCFIIPAGADVDVSSTAMRAAAKAQDIDTLHTVHFTLAFCIYSSAWTPRCMGYSFFLSLHTSWPLPVVPPPSDDISSGGALHARSRTVWNASLP